MQTIEEPIHVTDASFEQSVLKSSLPVVVDFWAPWCTPCRMVAPTLEKLAKENAGKLIVAKVDTDENPEWAGKFGVQGIPTMLFVSGRQGRSPPGGRPSREDAPGRGVAVHGSRSTHPELDPRPFHGNWRVKSMKRTFFGGAVVLLLLVTACAPAVPTVDPAMVQASAMAAASTMIAMTQAAIPTATETPVPSPTPLPSPTVPPLPTTVPPTIAANQERRR